MLTPLHYKVWESLFTHRAPAWRSRFYFSVDFGGPLQMVFHVRRVWKQRMAGPDVDAARPAATCNVLIPSIITCFPEKLIVASPSLPPSLPRALISAPGKSPTGCFMHSFAPVTGLDGPKQQQQQQASTKPLPSKTIAIKSPGPEPSESAVMLHGALHFYPSLMSVI